MPDQGRNRNLVIAGITAGRTQDGRPQIDGAACVVAGGQATAIAEERITRRKHAGGCAFALDAALASMKMGFDDVDLFVVSTCGEPVPQRGAPVFLRSDGLWTLQDMGVADDRIVWCPSHHLSHALHAHACAGTDKVLVCILDREGNTGETTSVFLVDHHEHRRVRGDKVEPGRAGGIGAMYAAVTDLLGLCGATQAGHTMALAAFAEPLEPPPTLLVRSRDGWEMPCPTGALGTLLVAPEHAERLSGLAVSAFAARTALAATAQKALEDAVAEIITAAVVETGTTHVMIGGGVGANCRLVGCMRRLFPRLVIRAPFAPGDTGQAIGNAIWGLRRLSIPVPAKLRQPFLGPDYPRERVAQTVAGTRCRTRTAGPDAVAHCLRLIREGAVVGLWQGRSEFGPRALGHRSLICRPDSTSLLKRLNLDIKKRADYRPFGCIVGNGTQALLEAEAYTSHFMEATITIPDLLAVSLSGVRHIDGSTRIQTFHPGYDYGPVLDLMAWSGSDVLLNTSFNGPGQPIVETPEEAVDMFETLRIDALFINDHLLER